MASKWTQNKKTLQAPVLQTVETTLGHLLDLWYEIGFEDGQKRERLQVVMGEMQALLEEMITEEQGLKVRLQESADQCRREYTALADELGVAVELPAKGTSLLVMEAEIRRKCDRLTKERHERRKAWQSLRDEEQQLCQCMRLEPVKDGSLKKDRSLSANDLPSLAEVEQYSAIVAKLRGQKAERRKHFVALRGSILANWDTLEYSPAKGKEKLHEAIASDEIDRFVLSSENLRKVEEALAKSKVEVGAMETKAASLREQMTTLWEKLDVQTRHRQKFLLAHPGCRAQDLAALRMEVDRLVELRQENMQRLVEKARTELYLLWDKCFYGPDQRKTFAPCFDDSYTEDLLAQHEDEVCRLQQHLTKHKPLYRLVEKRETLWRQKQQFDENASNPQRFNNRGGQLLKEERERRQVERDLPKVEKDLQDVVVVWEAETGRSFLVHDRPYLQCIAQQWEDLQQQRDDQKQKRQEQKKACMQEESLYGSCPTTPLKRKNCMTPGSASKVRRLAADVSHASSRFIHSSLRGSVCMSPTPTKTPKRKGVVARTGRITRSMALRKPLGECQAAPGLNTTFSADPVLAKGGAGNSITSVASSSISYSDFRDGLKKGCLEDTSHCCASSKAHLATAV